MGSVAESEDKVIGECHDCVNISLKCLTSSTHILLAESVCFTKDI